jgi:hypothetical protein
MRSCPLRLSGQPEGLHGHCRLRADHWPCCDGAEGGRDPKDSVSRSGVCVPLSAMPLSAMPLSAMSSALPMVSVSLCMRIDELSTSSQCRAFGASVTCSCAQAELPRAHQARSRPGFQGLQVPSRHPFLHVPGGLVGRRSDSIGN